MLSAMRARTASLPLIAALTLTGQGAAAAVPQRFAEGLLWEVRARAAPPSYLFGTLHSDDRRVVALPVEVEDALARSRRFALEVELTPGAVAELGQRMLLAPGESLEQLLPDEGWRRLHAAGAARGLSLHVLRRMQPGAVPRTLSAPPRLGGATLDVVLQQRARRAGAEVFGLESVAEQVAVFEAFERAEQLAMLSHTLNNLRLISRGVDELIDAWLARDLAAMQAQVEDHVRLGDEALNRRFLRELLDKRNERMFERMRPSLREGGTFVAVGALHLPGEGGLLERLHAAGFFLQRLY